MWFVASNDREWSQQEAHTCNVCPPTHPSLIYPVNSFISHLQNMSCASMYPQSRWGAVLSDLMVTRTHPWCWLRPHLFLIFFPCPLLPSISTPQVTTATTAAANTLSTIHPPAAIISSLLPQGLCTSNCHQDLLFSSAGLWASEFSGPLNSWFIIFHPR